MGQYQDALQQWIRDHPGSDASWAPREVRDPAWLEGGAPDPAHTPGSSLSGRDQDIVSRARSGGDWQSLYRAKNGLGAGGGGGGGGSGTPYSAPAQPTTPFANFAFGKMNMATPVTDPWRRFFDPTNPQSYGQGWRYTIQQSGRNPFAQTPYMGWLNKRAEGLGPYYLAQQALSGGNPGDLESGLAGFFANPNAQGGPGMLADLLKFYNSNQSNPGAVLSNPAQAGLLSGLMDPQTVQNFLSGILGVGQPLGIANAYDNILAKMRAEYELQPDQPDSGFMGYLGKLLGY